MLHLISDKLIKLIETHSLQILGKWTDILLCDPTTSSFSRENLDYVVDKAKFLLKNLGQWLSYETPKEEVGRRYEKEGVDLFRMGVPLCEAMRAMVVLRRIVWLYIVDESATDSAFELQQMKELNDRLVLFFDRAQYYFTRVYMEEMNKKIKRLWELTEEDTEQIFFKNSFYNR